MTVESGRRRLGVVVGIGGGLAFAGSLLYFAWSYATRFGAPAPDAGVLVPSAVNVALFTAFALHHSIFARAGLKAAVTRVVPAALERTTYVLVASVLFVIVCAAWQPVPGLAWQVGGIAAWLLRGVQLCGAVFTLVAARHLDILDLSGVRQALGRPSNRPTTLDDHGPYALVRHPIYLAWLLLVWAAPVMNSTRLVFAATSTVYLIAAIPFEERDLRRTFGDTYRKYADRVRYRIVPGVY